MFSAVKRPAYNSYPHSVSISTFFFLMVSIVIATSKIKIKVPTGIHHSKKIYEIYFNIQKAALGY